MSGDILTVKTVKRVRSVRGSALVHITFAYVFYNVSLIINFNITTDIFDNQDFSFFVGKP